MFDVFTPFYFFSGTAHEHRRAGEPPVQTSIWSAPRRFVHAMYLVRCSLCVFNIPMLLSTRRLGLSFKYADLA